MELAVLHSTALKYFLSFTVLISQGFTVSWALCEAPHTSTITTSYTRRKPKFREGKDMYFVQGQRACKSGLDSACGVFLLQSLFLVLIQQLLPLQFNF